MRRLTVLAAAAALLAAAPAAAVVIDRVVATVNDEAITLYELYKAELPAFGKVLTASTAWDVRDQRDRERERALLENMIEERLLLQRARERNLIATLQEVDEAVARVRKENNLSDEMFATALEKRGMTLAEYRGRLEAQIVVSRLVGAEVRAKAVVSPEEVRTYYEEHRGEYVTPARVRIRHIVLPRRDDMAAARARIEEALARVRGGADFAAVAREYSEAPEATRGELSDWIARGKTQPELDSVIFLMKPGEVSPIIESSGGLYVVRLEQAEAAGGKTLEQATPEITLRLQSKKAEERYKVWIEELRKAASIKIRL